MTKTRAVIAVFPPSFLLSSALLFSSPARAGTQVTQVTARDGSVEIDANAPPNFTTFTMTNPPRLVVDLAEAAFLNVPPEISVNQGDVVGIKTLNYGAGASAVARVLITYAKEVETDITTSGNNIIVHKSLMEVAAAKPAPVAPVAVAPPTQPAVALDAAPTPIATPTPTAAPTVAPAALAPVVVAEENAPSSPPPLAPLPTSPEPTPVALAPTPPAAEPVAAAPFEKVATAPAPAAVAAPSTATATAAPEPAPVPTPVPGPIDTPVAAEPIAAAPPARSHARREPPVAKEAPVAPEPAVAAAHAPAPVEAAPAPAPERMETATAAPPLLAQTEAAQAAPDAVPEPRAHRPRSAPVEVASAAPAPSNAGDVQVSSRRKILSLVGLRFEGTPAVFIRTNEPVSYAVNERGNDVIVTIQNTRIARSNDLRTLDASFFNSPIANVKARQNHGNVEIDVQLKSHATYQMTQTGPEVAVTFPSG